MEFDFAICCKNAIICGNYLQNGAWVRKNIGLNIGKPGRNKLAQSLL
jgi:hypothetical protein